MKKIIKDDGIKTFKINLKDVIDDQELFFYKTYDDGQKVIIQSLLLSTDINKEDARI